VDVLELKPDEVTTSIHRCNRQQQRAGCHCAAKGPQGQQLCVRDASSVANAVVQPSCSNKLGIKWHQSWVVKIGEVTWGLFKMPLPALSRPFRALSRPSGIRTGNYDHVFVCMFPTNSGIQTCREPFAALGRNDISIYFYIFLYISQEVGFGKAMQQGPSSTACGRTAMSEKMRIGKIAFPRSDRPSASLS